MLLHIISRQMKKNWQTEFEDKMVISTTDKYIFHSFVKKFSPLGKTIDRIVIISDLVILLINELI